MGLGRSLRRDFLKIRGTSPPPQGVWGTTFWGSILGSTNSWSYRWWSGKRAWTTCEGPQHIGLQALRRLHDHLDAVLQDGDREPVARGAGEPQPELWVERLLDVVAGVGLHDPEGPGGGTRRQFRDGAEIRVSGIDGVRIGVGPDL